MELYRSKKKKLWLIYAYSHKDGEIIGFTLGKRNAKTFKSLLLKLKELEIDFYCTDLWKVFSRELPYYQHMIGKKFTKAIEGINTCFRVRLRRLFRRTVCFSKKLKYHLASIKLFIYHRNLKSSYIL